MKQLKKNLTKLQKKPKSQKVIAAIERTERKIAKKLSVIEAFGVVEGKKPKRRKIARSRFSYGDYEKYMKSPEWSARKAAYYEEHHRECRSCGDDEKEVHLHHRTYARIYQEEDGDLVPLCRDCHAMLHLFQKTFKLPVEDATATWLSVTNGTPKKKKIRESLRNLTYERFCGVWERWSKELLPPAQHLGNIIEKITKLKLGAREDAIKNPESVKTAMAFAQRTGIMNGYDARVDALIRKLANQ